MLDVLREWNEIITIHAETRDGPARELILRSWTRSNAAWG